MKRFVLACTLVLLTLLPLTAQSPKKEPFKPTDEEQEIIDETNKEREKQKLPALKPSELLSRAARLHSENMAKKDLQDKVGHVLDGKNPEHRVRATGYVYLYVGENVAWNQRNPQELLKEWMNSPPHRANILDRRFTEIGIGVARSAKDEPYFTQVFGNPRRR